MRHRKRGRQLGRDTKHRWALFRSLVTSLLQHERIETTEAKAKEARGFAERMITLAKRGDLPARRQALAFIRSKDVVATLFGEVAQRFRDRSGGYTRMIKTRRRLGDAARLVTLELIAKRSPAEKKGGQPTADQGSKKEPGAGAAPSKESKSAAAAVPA